MGGIFKPLKKWLTRQNKGGATYAIACRIYLRSMGLLSLIAFASYWRQLPGLIGSKGLAPADQFLEAVQSHLGLTNSVLALPSLAWINSSDMALQILCGSGVACSVLLFLNVFPRVMAFLIWALYLSLANADRVFLSFQWDSLLIEMAFLTIFISPRRTFLFRWLLFKLMLSSGVVKLSSGDQAWRNLTALLYHYETQPLPTPLAWYAHQLLPLLQKASVVVMFGVELFVPFFIFASRPLRILAFYAFAALQALIMLTGNYGFFNLQALALSIFLLDDKYLRILPVRKYTPRDSRALRLAAAAVTVVFVAVGGIEIEYAFFRRNLPDAAYRVMTYTQPVRTINPYGLFAVMTTERREIIIQGSNDNKNWRDYEFKWKPGDLKSPPRYVAPYMPRLDWQMWFAALGTIQNNDWLQVLMYRMLQGEPTVLALLKTNPFPGHPPRHVRALSYHYEFTTPDERERTGAWWNRSDEMAYAEAISLPHQKKE